MFFKKSQLKKEIEQASELIRLARKVGYRQIFLTPRICMSLEMLCMI